MSLASIAPNTLALGLLLLAGTAAAQPGPQADAGHGAALELLPAGAQLLDCALSRGVLYVRFVHERRTRVEPAFHTPAIRRACAEAGHALAALPPARVAAPIVAPRIAAVAPAAVAAARGGSAATPSFALQSGGSFLAIDGRNDSDVSYHCSFNFAWAADGEPGGSRGGTVQATLPARQSQRMVFIPGSTGSLRFVGTPRWDCRPGG